MTRWQLFVEKWKGGCGSDQCRGRVVLARGSVPCDICFIGEGPGETENSELIPFCGRAGGLLDSIIERSGISLKYSCTFCNIVGCIPRDENGRQCEPYDEQVEQCAPRLREFIELANPRLLVLVGAHARDWLDDKNKHCIKLHKPIPSIHIEHPASLLRKLPVMRERLEQGQVIALMDAVEQYLEQEHATTS